MPEINDTAMQLLNAQVMLAYEARQTANICGIERNVEEIGSACSKMRTLDRMLREARGEMAESDSIVLSAELMEAIESFKSDLWPEIEARHAGIVTNSDHPFRNFTGDRISIREIDNARDCLAGLIENDQNTLTHNTWKLKDAADKLSQVTTLMASASRTDENKNKVKNQLIGT